VLGYPRKLDYAARLVRGLADDNVAEAHVSIFAGAWCATANADK
jgi:hypothetical protein